MIAFRRCDAEISISSMRRFLCGDADDAATATAVAFRRCDADDDSSCGLRSGLPLPRRRRWRLRLRLQPLDDSVLLNDPATAAAV